MHFGRRRAPLNEIEIELVEGEPGRLHELAVSLAADFPLSMAQVSKAERGYAMASPSPRKPVRAASCRAMTPRTSGKPALGM